MPYTEKMLKLTYAIDTMMKTMRRYAVRRDFLDTEEFLEFQTMMMDFQEKIFRRTDLPENAHERIEQLAFRQLEKEVINEHNSGLMRRKVYPDAVGNIVITDPTVLNIYARNNIDIDKATGTPLTPSNPDECFGNGRFRGYFRCCERCQHLYKCYPEKIQTSLTEDNRMSEKTFHKSKSMDREINREVPMEKCISVNFNEDELTILRYIIRIYGIDAPHRKSLLKKLDHAHSTLLSERRN